MQLDMSFWENVKQEDRFYPESVHRFKLEPLKKFYQIVKSPEIINEGIISLISLDVDDIAFKWTGYMVFEQSLHSLQYSPGVYCYDPHFSGRLLHDCSPNLRLEMSTLTAYVIKPIRPFDRITCDYEATETDGLFNSFQCSCQAKDDKGNSVCKGWISGGKKEIILDKKI